MVNKVEIKKTANKVEKSDMLVQPFSEEKLTENEMLLLSQLLSAESDKIRQDKKAEFGDGYESRETRALWVYWRAIDTLTKKLDDMLSEI